MSREVNVRPAITKGVSVNAQLPMPNYQPLPIPTPNHQSAFNNQQPITNRQSEINNGLAASHEVHDFHGVAFADDDIGKRVALDDF